MSRLPDAINTSPAIGFSQIPNELLRDKNLSFKARGMLCLLLSNLQGSWVSYIEGLKSLSIDGESSIRSGLAELEKNGYLWRVSYVDKRTKMAVGSFWSYTNIPFRHDIESHLNLLEQKGWEIWGGSLKRRPQNPYAEKRDQENPDIGFPHTGFNVQIIPSINNTKNKENQILTTPKNNSIQEKKMDCSDDIIVRRQRIKPPAKEKQKPTPEPKQDNTPYNEISLSWNKITKDSGMSPIIKLTPERKKHIKARMELLPKLSDWINLFEIMIASPFLCGETGWKASIDFVIKNEEKMIKTLEGVYSNSSPKPKRSSRSENPHTKQSEYLNDDPHKFKNMQVEKFIS